MVVQRESYFLFVSVHLEVILSMWLLLLLIVVLSELMGLFHHYLFEEQKMFYLFQMT